MSRFTIKIDDKELIGCNCNKEAKDFNDELLLKVMREIIPVLEERIRKEKPIKPADESLLDCLDYPNPPTDNSFDLTTFMIMCG